MDNNKTPARPAPTPCEYYNVCPSASGWCRVRHPGADCVDFLQTAYARLLHTACDVARTLDKAVGRLEG